MCGITGFIEDRPRQRDSLESTISAMTDALAHRGPDDEGCWLDPERGVALGHRRLSIIDLSAEGRQPMISGSRRYIIVFNGEIYNYRLLQQELASLGHPFRGHSDTEAVLAAIEEWGVEQAVTRFIGMFAFALWDTRDQVLYLVRDRLGIKPLYYGWAGQTFLFASELKAMRRHPDFVGEIDRNSLALYMRHNYVPSPYSIYKDVCKLPAGTMLRLDCSEVQRRPEPIIYWSARRICELGVAEPFEGSEEEAVTCLQNLLRDAVRIHMESDVPLGAFLSGGIDSSAVVAIMQEQSTRPVKTFTIGFHEQIYNEAEDAKAVATHLRTDHTELYVTEKEAMDCIPLLPQMYDEPFADSSQIPTYLISRLTRSQVTVSLSGDGGDELFAGYNRYVWVRKIWRALGLLPRSVRHGLSRPVGRVAERLARAMQHTNYRVFGSFGSNSLAGKLDKLPELMSADHEERIYRILNSHWHKPSHLVMGASEPPTILTDRNQWALLPGLMHRMMFLDLVTYLPDDILAKVDRASMAVSLEARVPLLDHRVVEFAWRIPLGMKLRNGVGKWILRQVLYKYVPQEMVERPKMGFGVPIGIWLRSSLREWAESLLDEGRLKAEGFFDVPSIRQKWREHVLGKWNWQYHLWDILMFEAWLEDQRRLPGR